MYGGEHFRTDSVLTVQTPEGIEFVLYPAGVPIRICAWVIDCFIQGLIVFAILITAGVLSKVLGIWFLLILIFALDWFYHAAFEVFCRGQSPGKRFMGIRVVLRDGSPVNPGAAFLRNLLRFADSFMFLYLIALISMLVSPGFRRLGDWAADTLVVYTASARIPGRLSAPVLRQPPWLDSFPALSASRPLGYEEKQALLSFARRYPLLGKARADEIAGIWAGRLLSAGPAAGAPVKEAGSLASGAEASGSAILLGIARSLGG